MQTAIASEYQLHSPGFLIVGLGQSPFMLGNMMIRVGETAHWRIFHTF